MKKPLQITIGEALGLLKEESPLVLDARDSHSYRAGHMEGAMLLHDGLMESIIKQRQYERPVLIYCFRGNLSLEKANLFAAAGFQRVYSLAGGYVAWMKQEGAANSSVTKASV